MIEEYIVVPTLDTLITIFCLMVVLVSLTIMFLNKPKGKETTMNIVASKLKIGDRILTPMGEAIIKKTKVTKIKIPARIEDSIVLMVNLSNGGKEEWTVGHTNMQVWGHEQITKIVEPGFFKKLFAFLRSL